VKLEIIVRDEQVADVVETIEKAARPAASVTERSSCSDATSGSRIRTGGARRRRDLKNPW
jgi:nitrogen regulatory protein PII